jgi:predicted amidohydrolase
MKVAALQTVATPDVPRNLDVAARLVAQATVPGEPTPAGVASDHPAWRVGLSICYDLRFPELYRALIRDAPCYILTVPAAFTHSTGLAHWELLLRARAVENQCFVIAAAQGGTHGVRKKLPTLEHR